MYFFSRVHYIIYNGRGVGTTVSNTSFPCLDFALLAGFCHMMGVFYVFLLLNNAKYSLFYRVGEKNVPSETCYLAENA